MCALPLHIELRIGRQVSERATNNNNKKWEKNEKMSAERPTRNVIADNPSIIAQYRVRNAMNFFLRKKKTCEVAVDAWRRCYSKLDLLFEVVGFGDFMQVIASNLLRDSIYGTIYRIVVGSLLST